MLSINYAFRPDLITLTHPPRTNLAEETMGFRGKHRTPYQSVLARACCGPGWACLSRPYSGPPVRHNPFGHIYTITQHY